MTTTPSRLHRLITAAFDENELRTLAFDLGVAYDALPGQGTPAKARELIAVPGPAPALRRAADGLGVVLFAVVQTER